MLVLSYIDWMLEENDDKSQTQVLSITLFILYAHDEMIGF